MQSAARLQGPLRPPQLFSFFLRSQERLFSSIRASSVKSDQGTTALADRVSTRLTSEGNFGDPVTFPAEVRHRLQVDHKRQH